MTSGCIAAFVRLIFALCLVLGTAPAALAAITVVASSSAGNGASSAVSSLSLSNPGSQSGDVLLAQLVVGSTGSSITAPSGWSSFWFDSGTGVTQQLFYRVAGASEAASYSFSFGSARASGGLLVLRGVNTSGASPIAHSQGNNGSGTTLTALAANVTSDNSLAVRYFAFGRGNNALSGPATQHYNPSTGAGTNGVAASASSAIQAVTGQTGDATASVSGSSDNWLAVTVVLAPSAQQVLSWNLEQATWTGAAGEVLDASGNALNGTVLNGAVTATSAPALAPVNAQGTCAYGSFNSSAMQYVQRAHNNLLNLQGSFSIGVWVKPRALPASGLMTILSKDTNYEFHLNPNGTVNWWWETTSPVATQEFNSSTALTAGQWSHVLIRYAPGDQRIYINGNLAGQANFSGTPVSNTEPLQLGADQGVAGRYFNGELDELKIYDGALTNAAIAALVAERHPCALNLQCFNDNFERTSLGGDWAVASRGSTAFTPVISSARMRLTSNQGNVATSSTLQRLFPAAGNYIQVQFKHFAYNGSGADGMAMVLSDASVTPQPGAFGGPLGYGTRGTAADPGFAGGWLGVGIDEYGNFSTEGGPGGPGQRADSVAIRGSGSVGTGYSYIAGTAANLNPGIDNAASTTAAPGHTYRVTMDGRFTNEARVTVERDSGAGFVVLPNLNTVNVLAATGQASLPTDFYLSLTGSTGGATNIHELDDLQVCATNINPVAPQVDHFEFSYASAALTCSPQPVTVRACLDASCSALFTSAVSVTLAPGSGWSATAPATVSGGNVLSFIGGSAVAQVRRTTVGTLNLGVQSSLPLTKANSQTLCSTANCAISFADSGLLLTVPNLLAAKPTPATISAVRKADDALLCVPAFANVRRSISFTSAYSNPATGTKSVVTYGPHADTSLLDFDANGTAPLTVRYDDAGLMTLTASYAGSVATADDGLAMSGSSDPFVSKPYGLLLQTDTDSACTADINCLLYKEGTPKTERRAGDPFSLRIKAVAWQSDGEALTAAALADNLVTPNFQLGNIALSSQLLAPVGGSAGTLGEGSYSHVLGTVANSNSTTVSQSVSEVGVFTLTATPPLTGYFGETVSASVSGLVGRFAPAYLSASGSASLTPSCGAAFSYQGQPMAFAVGQEPLLTVTGKNRNGGVTSNYDRGSFWRLGTPTRDAYLSVTTKASLDAVGRLSSSAAVTPVQSGADTGDGARSYRWSGETLQYSPAVLPLADDLPFTAAVRQGFSAAALTDADTVCNGVGTGCVAFNYDFANVPGSQVRLGRLRLSNAHGSELQGLALPFNLETWQAVAGASFQAELTDSCTTALVLGAPVLSSHTGNLAVGETLATVSGPLAAAGQVQLSAPGAGNDGSVQARFASQPTWLYFDWDATGVSAGRRAARGLASFGIYQGAKPLIFRRELYRTP
jgi:MSHA biogenesis protein MshQ